jgi:hypothetical protein
MSHRESPVFPHMPKQNEEAGPFKGDTEGANQGTPAAGGSGPRGVGQPASSQNPRQWGREGTSPQPEISGGRKGEEEEMLPSLDRERIDDEF